MYYNVHHIHVPKLSICVHINENTLIYIVYMYASARVCALAYNHMLSYMFVM